MSVVTVPLLSAVDEPGGTAPVEYMTLGPSRGDVGRVSRILLMTGRPRHWREFKGEPMLDESVVDLAIHDRDVGKILVR